jgi:protocatechuate 3,4-dioxygenase beta subunit
MKHLALAAFTVVALHAPAAAQAQALAGRVLDDDTRRPVAGALVELVRPDSSRVEAVLSGPDGRFVFGGGHDRGLAARVRRLGYRTVVVPIAPAVERGERPLEILLPVEAIELDPLVATGSGRCQVDPRRGAETALLWDQARKVLETTALIHERRLLRYQAVRYVRQLDPARRSLFEERLEVSVLDEPFRSPPARDLADNGFVRADGDETIYYMPDPPVILSDDFLERHCFYVAVQNGPLGRLVGLAFEPVSAGGSPDVAGVLWLDGSTAELRYLEYDYVGLRDEAEDVAGGRAEFELLEGGEWVVRRWVITMPILTEQDRFLGLGTRRVLAGVREEGGEILEAVTPDGRRASRPGPHSVVGRVRDPDTGRPLAGAVVHLSGTGRITPADPDGGFTFDGLSRGRYLATFTHPLLDTLGAYPPGQAFELPRPDEVLLLTFPGREALLAEACPDLRSSSMGTLTGTVTDPDGDAVAGAALRLVQTTSRDRIVTHQGRTDERGRYRLCDVPIGSPLILEVARDGDDAVQVPFELPSGGFARADVRLERAPF